MHELEPILDEMNCVFELNMDFLSENGVDIFVFLLQEPPLMMVDGGLSSEVGDEVPPPLGSMFKFLYWRILIGLACLILLCMNGCVCYQQTNFGAIVKCCECYVEVH